MESKNKSMLIAGLVVVVLAVGGFLALSGGDDETDTATNDTSQAATNTATPQEVTPEEAPAEDGSTVVELAVATDSLTTLVAALQEADLVDTLNGDGPFTVFAPTNDAFAALLQSLDVTAEELLARDDLSAILTYHVVAGNVMAADLSDGQVVETVQGGTLTVSVTTDGVTLTDANGGVSSVTATDIKASNGVVHLIDSVLLP